MSRLRQQYPQNYVSSGNINTEFENVIRYLNAAELGNKTVGELLDIIFDEDGEFAGPIDMRLDPTSGLQFRVGNYIDDESGWQTITDISSIRGTPGSNVGTIEGPFFYNRQEFVATDLQTVFSYNIDEATDDILVYVNGVLQQSSGVYTADSVLNTVTFGAGLALGDKVTIYSVRVQQVTNYRRSDIESAAGQAVFPFVHTADETLLVFRNGLVQIPGGGNDYTSNDSSDTVTFTSTLTAGEIVTILTVQNTSLTNVGGLMLEDAYTDENGLILYTKLSIANDQIPQSKVSGLATQLSSKAKISVSSSAPVGPVSGDFWLDTSAVPNRLKFYDGTQWLLTSPESTLPSFTAIDANRFIRVNASGTALEYGNVDFSTLVPKTFIGAANGVAELDSTGKLPVSQLPQTFAAYTVNYYNSGSVTNATVFAHRPYRQKIRIDGIAYKLAAGTCSIQLSIDGVTVGSVYAVNTTLANTPLGTVIEVDATTVSRRIELVITGATGASGLEVALALTTVTI